MDPTVRSENKSQDVEHHAPRDHDQGQGKPNHVLHSLSSSYNSTIEEIFL